MAQLGIVSDALERIGGEHGLARAPLNQLQVALDEIVSNVIKYAWPEGGIHDIRIRITVDAGNVRIDVADDGGYFDPHVAPSPPIASPGRRPSPGGVGLHMVTQLIDSFEYARIDRWNHSTLTKQCGAGMRAK
jgi:anti-sigma regulatory factor (Ser/Thr protein kinase)